MVKNKRFTLSGAIGWMMGLLCALVLGGVFYGAMAYQLLGDPQQDAAEQMIGNHVQLVLADAQLISEQTTQQEMGGETCTVTTRLYQTQDGLQVEVVCASPAAYIERLAQENWTPQLITGFMLAGLEAVYSTAGEEGMLSARAGERIFMLRAGADEQTIYALGAGAALE